MADQAAVEQSVASRMEALLEIEDAPPEQEAPARAAEEAPAEGEPEQEAPAEEAAPEGEEPAQEETTEERKLRLKHDGVEIEKPESEVIALAQQGFDYTQKTQKLAEDRKAVETYAQTLKAQEQNFAQQVQVQAALTQDIAKVTAIDLQLGQYQNLDWQALSNTDPVEAQKLFFSYTQLKTTREQAMSEVQQKQQAFSSMQNQARAKQVELGQQVLAKEIPGWGPELAKTLVATGKEYGFDDKELANLTDPRAVKLLHDAAQWRKLQASKPAVDKKVATASPVIKPAAKESKNTDQALVRNLRESVKKTGSRESAQKLIERML